MIEIKNCAKSYDGKKFAVKDLNLVVRDGEIFGLLGPNGAGKSTLLKMMVGVLAPTKGDISLNGHSITTDTLEAKRQFAYVSDNPDHLLRLKGIEFLNFIADIYKISEDKRQSRIEQLAKEFGMYDELDNRIQSYSHGMRQKMMVIGALLSEPDIWLLDEPMTGLDPRASFYLKQKMREHADSGKTVLFSTHVLDVAEKVVDRVGIINQGELIFVGTVAEMQEHFQANTSLEEMFLELTQEEAKFLDEGPENTAETQADSSSGTEF
ncbi:MAG: ABC transporter ATP-binding protein [Eubacteriales bacterium]|nr:ABC transporter ATP-binding protein [Eubacteriales bacterium]